MMDAIVRRARPWLGTLVEMRVEGLPESDALAAIEAAFAEIAVIHLLMSFHEADSDLARVHRARAGDVVAIDARTAEVLRCALEVAERSGGAFDPTVAAHAVGLGHLPRPGSSCAPDAAASWHDIELIEARHIRLRRTLWIDLGGIAKGYAVDRAMEILMRARATQACVNAGGDLRVAGACEETIALRIAPGTSTHVIALQNGAVASSASSSLLARGSGRRASTRDNCIGVSVAAPSCMLADALTKVALIAPARVAASTLSHFGAQASIHTPEGWREVACAA